MTLIECFTDFHIDNIASCLCLQPHKQVFVGDISQMTAPVTRYKKLLQQRRLDTEVVMCNIRDNDFNEICTALMHLLEAEQECVLDLTGGDETVIMAVGAVMERLKSKGRKQISVWKMDYDTGALIDCADGSRMFPKHKVYLTVEELILLHGGRLYPEAKELSEDCTWKDIEGLWRIVCEAPKEWNRSVSLLNEMESRSDSKMEIYLPLDVLHGTISNFEQKEEHYRAFLDKLSRNGIIDDYSSRNLLKYTYRSPLKRYCTQKAGNVLEVKTLLEGKAAQQKGHPFFQDCRMSVSIDWDGIVHTPEERIPDTRNEIDVVLMHGLTPLFISCKNGNIGEEELYKLHTVAQRFGGPRARKMLIATDLDRKSVSSNRAFMQRSWDMDIFLETDAAELSREKWEEIFLQAMQ